MTRKLLSAVVVLSCVGSNVWAQSAPSRAWIEADFLGLHSTQREQTHGLTFLRFGEFATAESMYPALPSTKGVLVGGGVRIYRSLGFAVHLDFSNYESAVDLAVRIPNPVIPSLVGVDMDTAATPLDRRDRSFDFAVSYLASTPSQWRVRIFGGPTYFRVSQELVKRIQYEQRADITGTNFVNITGFDKETVDGSAWGLNVGADVGYFLSRHVGVGGLIRVTRGTVTIEDPLSLSPTDLTAGHVTFGVGLRLRF